MANRTISTQSLTPGVQFCVRGKLTYGRLAKQVDGEELEKDALLSVLIPRQPLPMHMYVFQKSTKTIQRLRSAMLRSHSILLMQTALRALTSMQ